MDKFLYTCQYCGKEYIPNRRHKQRFCSNSCRVNSFNRNRNNNLIVKPDLENKIVKPLKIEKISMAGVGNAAIGSLAIQLATNLFTSEDDKPATKKDLTNLIVNLKERYHTVKNIPIRNDGAIPNYDLQTQTIVYLI